MSQTAVVRSEIPELRNILAPGERLLWSGQPVYGRKLFQAVGQERLMHTAFLAAILVLWAAVPFAPDRPGMPPNTPILICVAATLAFTAISLGLAAARRSLLNRLAYFVSDKRAIICRRGRNWKFESLLHVVSFPRPNGADGPMSLIAVQDTDNVVPAIQLHQLALEGSKDSDWWARMSAEITYERAQNPQTVLVHALSRKNAPPRR